MTHRKSRDRSTSCSSTASQSSMASIYARINQSVLLAVPQEGLTNVYGSFTTTIPAALWLRDHISSPRKRRDCGYDTPPDSPLSLFQSFPSSKRSPSISRTLLSDPDYPALPVESPTSSPSSPPSPAIDCDDHPTKLHPILKAIERSSRLACRSTCSTCMKQGTNFPRCPRCDEMWCSRACRLQGGKKHVCAIRNI